MERSTLGQSVVTPVYWVSVTHSVFVCIASQQTLRLRFTHQFLVAGLTSRDRSQDIDLQSSCQGGGLAGKRCTKSIFNSLYIHSSAHFDRRHELNEWQLISASDRRWGALIPVPHVWVKQWQHYLRSMGHPALMPQVHGPEVPGQRSDRPEFQQIWLSAFPYNNIATLYFALIGTYSIFPTQHWPYSIFPVVTDLVPLQ
jgi:hypothetical protein